MIVADKKPIEEIIEEIKDHNNILILGCNECVTVCEAGGKKEVGILASALRMYFLNQGQEVKIDETLLLWVRYQTCEMVLRIESVVYEQILHSYFHNSTAEFYI